MTRRLILFYKKGTCNVGRYLIGLFEGRVTQKLENPKRISKALLILWQVKATRVRHYCLAQKVIARKNKELLAEIILMKKFWACSFSKRLPLFFCLQFQKLWGQTKKTKTSFRQQLRVYQWYVVAKIYKNAHPRFCIRFIPNEFIQTTN